MMLDVTAISGESTTAVETLNSEWPILVCMLGDFCVRRTGALISIRPGGKEEQLLTSLALRYEHGMAREQLICALWPEEERQQANQSLNSLVYSVQRRLLGPRTRRGDPAILGGRAYRLNPDAGVCVDAVCFDRLASAADRHAQLGDTAAAVDLIGRALEFYRGDLVAADDPYAIIERERLRAMSLALLAQLANYAYSQEDFTSCLRYAQRLLQSDACSEEAHRLAMRSYVRLGQRGQALRQYRLCETILRAEYDAEPEPQTRALFDEVRLKPAGV